MLDLLGPLAKVVPPPPGRATVPPPAGDHEDRVVQGGRLLVLATKNSDSETTVKAMDVAATLKAMAKSNDPKVREAAALMEAEASSRSKSLSSLQHDRPWRQEGIDSESGAAAMDDHSAGGHAQPAASVRASQQSGAVRASEGGAHEHSKRQHLFSRLYRPVTPPDYVFKRQNDAAAADRMSRHSAGGHAQPAATEKCVHKRCGFLAHSDGTFGKYCCLKCKQSDEAGKLPEHGRKCEGKPTTARRAGPGTSGGGDEKERKRRREVPEETKKLPKASQEEEPEETKKLPKARGTDSGTVVSAHQDVVGEKELREFLTEKGFGHRKAYYWSCLADYKGPRSCRKLSKFLEQCGSIEVYVEGDGKQSIRLAAAFAPAA